ncbi:hypothetical protein K469DRAFT_694849 [Zopfia rhizophila CBS 207.26]|uniref:Uncharacterized protein n=1 Tax=Zopfia rhizophila CBS 207.26 TaxID=1314779 RepID=A0A6A6ERV2_9PEZI|nr:hypothetical protein K469DRAFT_694849 [Zopfia rhizophila CBS 207.26]
MHFSTLLLPLGLTLTVAAEPLAALPEGVEYAHQYARSASHLAPRLDADPNMVCGEGYNDCNNGWCCGSGRSCAGELEGIPVCKAPGYTLGPLKGTAVATPYKNLESVVASMSDILAGLTAVPTGSVSNSEETGGAAGGPASFGKGVGTVAVLWGAAALGGAGWFFL